MVRLYQLQPKSIQRQQRRREVQRWHKAPFCFHLVLIPYRVSPVSSVGKSSLREPLRGVGSTFSAWDIWGREGIMWTPATLWVPTATSEKQTTTQALWGTLLVPCSLSSPMPREHGHASNGKTFQERCHSTHRHPDTLLNAGLWLLGSFGKGSTEVYLLWQRLLREGATLIPPLSHCLRLMPCSSCPS